MLIVFIQSSNKVVKTLGIVGGLGPETSFQFGLNVNNKFRSLANCQPNIILNNLPISSEAEREIIQGGFGRDHLKLIIDSVRSLNNAGVDFIAIPCNTVHAFISEIRQSSKKPVLSIIEECAKVCHARSFKKLGLLGSTKTAKENLHSRELSKFGINVVMPIDEQQENISQIIVRIIHNKATRDDRLSLSEVISSFASRGAEAVILACTDLPLLISEKDSCIPMINTLTILEDAVVRELMAAGGK